MGSTLHIFLFTLQIQHKYLYQLCIYTASNTLG